MRGFGYQDAVVVDDREFRIHTGCEPDQKRILSEVFEEGRFVYSLSDSFHVRPYNSESVEETYLEDVTFRLHQSLIDEINVLFYAAGKLVSVKDPQPHYRLGKLFLSRNLYQEAIKSFQNAIRLDAGFIRAHQRLAIAFLKSHNFEEAIDICNSALEQHPEFPDLLDLIGIVYSHYGSYEKGKNALQKAIKIKPDYLESQFNLGVVLFLSTLSDEDERVVIPVRIMRMLIEIRKQDLYKNDIWQDRFLELDEIIQTGNKKEIVSALMQFQIHLTTHEDAVASTIDYFLIKFMYGGKEIDDSEMAFYEQRISEIANNHGGYPDYWNELGVIHLIQCRDYFLKAVNEFERAVEINPKYLDAKNNNDLLKHNKKGFLILLRAILR